MNLSKNTKLTKVKAAEISAGTEVLTDSVDMAGWEGVMFFGVIATANAGNFAKAQQSEDDFSSDTQDLAGTQLVTGDNNDSFLLDIVKPRDRYVRASIIRAGANTALGDIYALQYGPRKKPSTHGATIDSELHVSPAEGTA